MSQAASPAGQDVANPMSPEATVRPTSPQEFSVNTSASGGSGNIPIPNLSMRSSTAVIAAQRAQMSAVARAGQEATILTIVRKQIDALEEKLAHQIERATQQADRTREAISSRVDQKMTSFELKQQTVERNMAKLAGPLDAFSEEIKRHEERFSSGDTRMSEWRRTMEEDFQSKLRQLETNFEQLDRSIKVIKSSNEEIIRGHNQRILKLETHMEQSVADHEDKHQSIAQLHVRLSEVESTECERTKINAIVPTGGALRSMDLAASSPQDKLAVAAVESQVTDMTRMMQQLRDDMQCDKGDNNELRTLVHTHEERLSTLRKRQEERDQQFRTLEDRIQKENWDMKLKDLQIRMEEMDKHRGDLSEKAEIMQNSINHHKDAHTELKHSLRRLHEKSSESLALMAAGDFDPSSPMSPHVALGAGFEGAGGVGMGDVLAQEMLAQVKDMDDRIAKLSQDMREVRTDSKIGPAVAALVGTLQGLTPKVNQQEEGLKELQEKVERKANESAMQEEIRPKIQDISVKLDELSDRSNQGVNMMSQKQKSVEKQIVAFDDRFGRLEALTYQIRNDMETFNVDMYGDPGNRIGGGIPEHEEDADDEDQLDPETLQSQRKAEATE